MLRDQRYIDRVNSVFENRAKDLYRKGTIFEKYELVGSTVIKGILGEEIVKQKLEDEGYETDYRLNSEHDILIIKPGIGQEELKELKKLIKAGELNQYKDYVLKAEIKTSAAGEPKNYYKANWTHVSTALDWDVLILLTHNKDSVFLRYMWKHEVEDFIKTGMPNKEAYNPDKYKHLGGEYFCFSIGNRNQERYLQNTKEITSESFKFI